jgi:hypothetical protein
VCAPFVVYRLVRGVLELGHDAAQSHTALRATPWGIEAFARGYAAAHGMVLEDPQVFRRGFASPVPGIALKVLHGPLADGLAGRLVLWLDATDLSTKRYGLLAIVPAGDLTAVHPPEGAPYSAFLHAGALVLSLEVPDAGRTAANLEALAAAAALLRSYEPLSSH